MNAPARFPPPDCDAPDQRAQRVTLPDWPRLMRVELACRYLGLGETKFRSLGIASRAIGGAVLWDIRDLDRWADALSGAPLDESAREAEGADILNRVKGRLGLDQS